MNRAPAIIFSQGYKPSAQPSTLRGAAGQIIGAIAGLALIYTALTTLGSGWVEIIKGIL